MSCYLIGQMRIHDRTLYEQYAAGFREFFKGYNGRLIAVDDGPEVLEGEWGFTRVAIIELESRTEAERFYHSPEYQEITRNFRQKAADNLLLLAESLNVRPKPD